jgi:ribosome-binding ATPase YchF (GTP1/OBG family)
MLRAGIVGLPNVGKSTLFNAITRSRKAEAANYPFCTIDPNVGMVTVPDARLEVLRKIAGTTVIIPAAIEFVDIAGLVKGASQGEGLGNKFLTHVREVGRHHPGRALLRRSRRAPCRGHGGIRCAISKSSTPSSSSRISTAFSGDANASPRTSSAGTRARRRKKSCWRRLETALDSGKPAFSVPLSAEDRALARPLFLLTDKPTIFACNVKESDLATAETNPYVVKVREYVKSHLNCEGRRHKRAARERPRRPDAGRRRCLSSRARRAGKRIAALIRATYHLLGLQTYFTAGEKEVRAWTIRVGDTAPKAAGVIHSDFERGFIKAETVAYDDLVACGSVAAARGKGLYRMEGKEYVVADGDVLLFKFNV